MGELILKTRDEAGLSQSDPAGKINRRPATISDIENGKFDICVQTLLVLAIVLGKPISYFFPQSLLKDMVMVVKSEFQHKALNYLGIIEFFGAQEMTLKILKVISDDCEEQLEDKNNYPENNDEQEYMQYTLHFGDNLKILRDHIQDESFKLNIKI